MTAPPQCSQVTMSILNTRFNRCAQVIETWRVGAGLSGVFALRRPRLAGVTCVFRDTEYLLDPHTVIGVRAAPECRTDAALPLVTLGTAHPAKFPDAIRRAGVPREPQLPLHMADLLQRPE